jgi:Antibiotic biosynthesis monooxygenase
MNEPVRMIARFTARPEQQQALRETLCALIEPTRREPGCLRYGLSALRAVAQPIRSDGVHLHRGMDERGCTRGAHAHASSRGVVPEIARA